MIHAQIVEILFYFDHCNMNNMFKINCTHANLIFIQNHRFSYGEPMTVESSTQAICDLALRFGEGEEETMVRIVFFFGGGGTSQLQALFYYLKKIFYLIEFCNYSLQLVGTMYLEANI